MIRNPGGLSRLSAASAVSGEVRWAGRLIRARPSQRIDTDLEVGTTPPSLLLSRSQVLSCWIPGVTAFPVWLVATLLLPGCMTTTQDTLDSAWAYHPQHVELRLLELTRSRPELAYRFYARGRQLTRRRNSWIPPFNSLPPERTIDLSAPPGCLQRRLFAAGADGIGLVIGTNSRFLRDPLRSPRSSLAHLSQCDVLVYTEVTSPGTTDLVMATRRSELARVRRKDAVAFDPSLPPNLVVSVVYDVIVFPLRAVGILYWIFSNASST